MSQLVSPAQNDTPPPIRLDKHPSLRKQHATKSPSESSNGGAFKHSVGSLNEDILFNERATSQQSVSPPDEGYSEAEEAGSGHFPRDPDPSSSLRGQRGSEAYLSVTMTSPHVNVGPQEEYVTMVSAPVGSAGTLPTPKKIIPSHYDVPPPVYMRSLSKGDSVSSSARPSNYEEAPTLSAAVTRYRQSYMNMEVVKECTVPTRADSSTPPSNELHLHYAQHHTQSSATDTTPPIPPRVAVVNHSHC